MRPCCADCAAMRAWRRLLTDTMAGPLTGTIAWVAPGAVRATLVTADCVHAFEKTAESLADTVETLAEMLGADSLVAELRREREALRRAATIPAPAEDEREVPRC